ncbi:hypothetical protein OOU_Y34scaffold00589g30 [Pyricularia oryzae Y34]|uniref:Uncharacterized protein n=3 Tax=Pyricularia oryzae TaxID=318829 RepID=A0A4V1C521_PYROR|nr:hypothetical protein OOU_Y34scaffold00589g30 [Pyricularia oryzae Y34]QBZ54865.1 hypothetical protein PoMZ_10575 [Pyricularia oryzae]
MQQPGGNGVIYLPYLRLPSLTYRQAAPTPRQAREGVTDRGQNVA